MRVARIATAAFCDFTKERTATEYIQHFAYFVLRGLEHTELWGWCSIAKERSVPHVKNYQNWWCQHDPLLILDKCCSWQGHVLQCIAGNSPFHKFQLTECPSKFSDKVHRESEKRHWKGETDLFCPFAWWLHISFTGMTTPIRNMFVGFREPHQSAILLQYFSFAHQWREQLVGALLLAASSFSGANNPAWRLSLGRQKRRGSTNCFRNVGTRRNHRFSKTRAEKLCFAWQQVTRFKDKTGVQAPNSGRSAYS